jgi:hypothetical protein
MGVPRTARRFPRMNSVPNVHCPPSRFHTSRFTSNGM